MMVAQVCGSEVGDYVHTFGDVHIYNNHFEQVKLQLSREPRALPTMKLNPEIKDLFDRVNMLGDTLIQLSRLNLKNGLALQQGSQTLATNVEKLNQSSKEQAELYGEPEWCVGTGKRNTHTMAIAPTKSMSLIMGGVSEGINPDPSMMYVQTTAAGEVIRINPVLLGIMKERSIDIDQASSEIQLAKGSVQGLSWLSDKEKEVFKTAFEMDMDNIVRMASARQRYVDQAQSLNLFFSTETPEEKVASVHKKAFLDKYIKSLYYIYSMPGIEPAKDNCIACT